MIIWASHVARTGRREISTFLLQKLKERNHWGDIGLAYVGG
jgi:hypothetical protein